MSKTYVKGGILSETSFFVVKEVNAKGIVVVDDHNNELEISKTYADSILNSADDFDKEEKASMTELADLFINNPRVAMTVAYITKDNPKTQKAYNAEKEARIKEVQEATVAKLPVLLNNLIENPVLKVIPGELRVMKGRHAGFINELGRVQFTDMELPKSDPTARLRWVDPRTIQYVIVNRVKTSLKK